MLLQEEKPLRYLLFYSICNLLGVNFILRIKNYYEQLLYIFKDISGESDEN